MPPLPPCKICGTVSPTLTARKNHHKNHGKPRSRRKLAKLQKRLEGQGQADCKVLKLQVGTVVF